MVPKTNAIATDRKIPIITERAFSVLSKSSNPRAPADCDTFTTATTKVAPSSSNTIDTVVEVGMPKELNTSSKMMSVTITAIKMQIKS